MTPLRVSITTQSPSVEPGTTLTLMAQVRNTGPEIVRCTILPAGWLAPWTVVSPDQLRIWPADEASVTLTVSVPRQAQPPAGPSTVGVRVLSEDGTAAESSVRIDVEPFLALTKPELEPYALRTRCSASTWLRLSNTGNTGASLVISVRDRDGTLIFPRPRQHVDCGPDQSLYIEVPVRCRRLNWFGPPETRPFTVTVEGKGLPEATVDGTLIQSARLTPLVLVLTLGGLGLLVPAAIIAAMVALFTEGDTRLGGLAALGVMAAVILAILTWLRRV